MRIKFSDVVRSKVSKCKKCYKLIYTLPTEIDRTISDFFISFGKPKYDLDILNLFYIDAGEDYIVQSRLGENYLWFHMPKEAESWPKEETRIQEFEDCLLDWLRDRLPELDIYE